MLLFISHSALIVLSLFISSFPLAAQSNNESSPNKWSIERQRNELTEEIRNLRRQKEFRSSLVNEIENYRTNVKEQTKQTYSFRKSIIDQDKNQPDSTVIMKIRSSAPQIFVGFAIAGPFNSPIMQRANIEAQRSGINISEDVVLIQGMLNAVNAHARELDTRISACNLLFGFQAAPIQPAGVAVENEIQTAKQCYEQIKSDSASGFSSVEAQMLSQIDTAIRAIRSLAEKAATEEKIKNEEIIKLESRLSQFDISRLDADKSIFQVGVPIFAGVILSMLIIPLFYKEQTQKSFFESTLILNLFTVFILSMAIIILAVTQSLEKQAIGTLLGGIAGYVLGSAKKA
jgi:hypothetical protein